jgi:GMP synthase-like glutamine amidotransferase
MRVLFLQHDPGSRPALVGEHLAARGAELTIVRMSQDLADGTWHGAFPDPLAFDLVVSLGAIWSLYDRTQVGSWIDRELDLLRRADEHDVPVLGICFGGQALAAAHGGAVRPADRAEVGWVPVATDVPDLVPPGPWMQWHSDRFDLPAGAVELARNEICPQAFRLRRNLGVQFHPEVDVATVRAWLELGGEAAVAQVAAAGSTVEAVLADSAAHEDRARHDLGRLVDRFLVEVAGLD